MSSASTTLVRFAGAALLAGFLSVAACSANGRDNTLPEPDGDASPPRLDATTPGSDAGPDAPSANAECGNLKLEQGEQCDDGNTADDDGCSSSCKVESALEGDLCPGKTITLQDTLGLLKGSVTGTTAGAYGQYGSGCGGGSAKDVVYTFTPSSSGKAVIELTADYAAVISARSDCEVASSESKCAGISAATGGKTTIEIPVFQNTPVFLFVDGYGGGSGNFTLGVQISRAVCGNGIAELPEACDDGNTTAGDGCSATCTLEGGGAVTQCPGQPFLLSGPAGQPRKIGFSGDTLAQGVATQNGSGCLNTMGPNLVYALKSDISGSVDAELLTGYTKAGLHSRTDCGSNDFQIVCAARETPGSSSLHFPVKANEWFYIIVDGDRSGFTSFGGPFSLQVEVTPGACGNHVLDGSEECDDGNAETGDGCTPGCTLEPLPAADTCPGHTLPLVPQADGSRTAVVSGSTRAMGAHHTRCGLSGTGPDAVFAVTPDIDGYLTASLGGPFNTLVSIRSYCEEKFPDAGTVPDEAILACSYKLATAPAITEGMGSDRKTVGTRVLANTTYWIVVDGASSNGGSRGPFELDVAVRPPVCGNGIVEGTEQCDDGGTDADDGCDPTCNLEPVTSRSTCGDAETITLTETAPGTYSASLARGTTNLLANGNISSFTSDDDEVCWAPGRNAFFAIAAPAAGVLRATAKSDAFDVVLSFQKPSCALLTMPFMCGNNSPKGQEESLAMPVTAGEVVWIVVDSKSASDFGRFTLDVSVTPSGCGDGFFVPGPNEHCDDGNNISGDGCSATCVLEPIGNVDMCPGHTLDLSGTGTQPRRGRITFSTAALSASYAGACGGGSREGVVKVVAPISGLLRAKTRGMYGSTLYARTTCSDPTTEISKSKYSTCIDVVHDAVSFHVTAGKEYFLFVDGLDAAVGVPTLDVTIDP